MRDNLKNINYFRKYMSELEKDINNESDFEYLSTLLFQKVIAKYSIGEGVNLLINDYNDTVNMFIKSFDCESVSYNSLLNIISLSIIFNTKNIKKLESLIKESDKFNDYIIQFLISSNNYEIYNVKWEKYLPLKSIIENYKNNKKEAEKEMKLYLDKWYLNNKNAYWYEAHKSKAKIYFGYWCLEAAALTYILDLDDSEYLDNQYYPKDLVKYARNKK